MRSTSIQTCAGELLLPLECSKTHTARALGKKKRSSVLTCSKGINTPNAEDSFVPTKKALYCPATNTNLYLISLFWRFNYSILSVSSHSAYFTNCISLIKQQAAPENHYAYHKPIQSFSFPILTFPSIQFSQANL